MAPKALGVAGYQVAIVGSDMGVVKVLNGGVLEG
jgi:hypothetical protein